MRISKMEIQAMPHTLTTRSIARSMDTIRLSFFAEGINRLDSTLLCEVGGSYVQQSQRYVEAGNYHLGDARVSADDVFVIDEAFELYKRMTEVKSGIVGRPKREDFVHGIPFEDARYILPLAATTNIMVNMTLNQFVELEFRALEQGCDSTKLLCEKIVDSIESLNEAFGELFRSLIPRWVFKAAEFSESAYGDYILGDAPTTSVTLLKDQSNISLERVAYGALTSTTKNPFEKPQTNETLSGVTERVLGYHHTSILEQSVAMFHMRFSSNLKDAETHFPRKKGWWDERCF